jgi:hypothetical protein
MDQALTAGRNVIELFGLRRRSETKPRYAFQASANYCSHCGGWLAVGESEDDCSSALVTAKSGS